MTIKYSKRFRKQFQKRRSNEQDRFWDRLEIFKIDPHAKELNHHMLTGKYSGFHSISVGGDLRALYYEIDGDIILFDLIGTHSQLYG